MQVKMRAASYRDVPALTEIFNQGIEDGNATFETVPRTPLQRQHWLETIHDRRFRVYVAIAENGETVGYIALNRFTARECHRGISEISVYVRRECRNQKVGQQMLSFLSEEAKHLGFHKLVINVFAKNKIAIRSYRNSGFRKVGIWEKHALYHGEYADMLLMEKLLI